MSQEHDSRSSRSRRTREGTDARTRRSASSQRSAGAQRNSSSQRSSSARTARRSSSARDDERQVRTRGASGRSGSSRGTTSRAASSRSASTRNTASRSSQVRGRTTARTNTSAKSTNAKASNASASKRRTRRRGKVSPEQRARMRKLNSMRMAGVACTAVVLALGAVVGLMFFLRPTTSEVERRTLTERPSFSLGSFWDGSFFSDYALFYSDTYPLREPMVGANQVIEGLHGLKTDTQMVGGARQADELPPADGAQDEKKDDSKKKKESVADRVERGSVEVPDAEAMAEAVQNQVLDGLYVKGDAAYNIYYFSQEAAQQYADMVSFLADTLDGQATVYSVLVPNASGVLLSDQEVKDLGGTNQVDAIKYFYSLMGDNVHDVDAVGNLRKHTDDYIYFRTDHHWTELGGYYGYEAFCEAKDIEPVNRKDLEHKDFGDFLGSFYAQLQNPDMAAHPDTVEAWIPSGTNDMEVWDADGNKIDYQIITDTSEWDIAGKNMAFIMGDQPLEHMHNPDLDDGSTCLIIIDSYGCYFVPWLVDSYEDLWVADFRYFNGSYSNLITENNIEDVIVLNNVSLAGGGVVPDAILGKW